MRIAWALLVPLTGGVALLAYIVAWVVVPEEAKRTANVDTTAATVTEEAEPHRADDGRAALLIGGGLVLIGTYFLVREYLPRIDWGFVWPLILVGVGVLILLGAARRR